MIIILHQNMQSLQHWHLQELVRADQEIVAMGRSKHTYRFKAGDLVEVAETPPDYFSEYSNCAPVMAGLSRRMRYKELRAGDSYLVLQDAKHSTHRDNRKLYVEVMTPDGPALCWCNVFRMKKHS